MIILLREVIMVTNNAKLVVDDYITHYNRFKKLLDSYEPKNQNQKALRRSGLELIAQINAITDENDRPKLNTMTNDHLSKLDQMLTLCTQAITDLQNRNEKDVRKSCKELRSLSGNLPVKNSKWESLAPALLSFVGLLMIVAGTVAIPFTMGLSTLVTFAGGIALGAGYGGYLLFGQREGVAKATYDFAKATKKSAEADNVETPYKKPG